MEEKRTRGRPKGFKAVHPDRECIDCKEVTHIAGRDRCRKCYAKFYYKSVFKHKEKNEVESKTLGLFREEVICEKCHQKKFMIAKGLCRNCYQSQYMKGKPVYKLKNIVKCCDCSLELPNYSEGKCKKCYMKDYYKRPGEKEKNLISKRFNRSGFSANQINGLRALQSGRCGICIIKLDPENRKTHPGECADHDHETNLPRGLLCVTCNIQLGRYEKKRLNGGKCLYVYERYLRFPPIFLLQMLENQNLENEN